MSEKIDAILSSPGKRPALWQALLPVVVLIGLLVVNVVLFSDNATYGPNQIALLMAAVFAGVVGYANRVPIKHMLEGINKSLGSAIGALLILLLVGSLAGTWLISGIVPAMIYYGLQVLEPTYFLVAAAVICSIVSVATGSSWSTVATVGVALLAIGKALGISDGWIVGAIISGAYFGDKISPLSDTTNLAPAMAGTELFTHIRYMLYTTVPSIILTLIIFLLVGFTTDIPEQAQSSVELSKVIEGEFNLNPLLFVVPAVVVVMVIMKFDAVVALFIGTILGGLFALYFQPDVIEQLSLKAADESVAGLRSDVETLQGQLESGESKDPEGDQKKIEAKEKQIESKHSQMMTAGGYVSIVNAMFGETNLKTKSGNEKAEKLLSAKGMSGMLNTVWLIIMAMCFGGVMEACGLLKRITDPLVTMARSDGALVATTAGSCMFTNLTASDQYLAIVVPGRMFRETYAERGLAPENLSRTLEDSGTVTSTLVPWNTCAAYHSGVLGVAALTFAPFCLFNIISPLMTIMFAALGIKIRRLDKGEKKGS